MQRKTNFLPIFIICLIFALVAFFLSQTFLGQGTTGLVEQLTTPLQRFTFQTMQGESDSSETQLQQENKKLLLQLAKQKDIEKENKALRDQFETTSPSSHTLLPAQVIGLKDEALVIDKGSADKVAKGMVVVVKDNLVGRIVKVSTHLSVIELVTHKHMSFTAETVNTSALGVSKGKGGSEIFLENVVLSDKLEKNDIVKTKGDIDNAGNGYPPGLVVGKIVSVNKKASALFQTAEVQSFVDFSRLKIVFLVVKE